LSFCQHREEKDQFRKKVMAIKYGNDEVHGVQKVGFTVDKSAVEKDLKVDMTQESVVTSEASSDSDFKYKSEEL
jgi:hypothetical protein